MIILVSDAFAEHYTGGAELTTQAIIDASLFPVNKILSQQVTLQAMQQYRDSLWIFGNFTGVSSDCVLYAIKNLTYCVIEYDYKYCKYRSVKKHEKFEDKCDCAQKSNGKLVAAFLGHSQMNFWMSKGQCEAYKDVFPFIQKNTVLSSVFCDATLARLTALDISQKNEKWIILESPSWIKGKEGAIAYAKENNLDYELVWGLEYDDLLQKLAESRGLILLPLAADTCPRLAIEAKILGCELVLNDNVQHKDEAWFESRETILSYLQTRGDSFWRKIEEIVPASLGFSTDRAPENLCVKAIVPFYNAESWIHKCVKSLKAQEYKNFECYLVDDMSDDNSAQVVAQAIDDDNRFKLIQNENKYYALENISRAIDKAACNDDDIIVLLDGDDWLASANSFDTVVSTYQNKGCLLTYGSYVYNPGGQRGVEPSRYPDEVIENNSFRSDQWRASHLRSFKYLLWRHLDHDDLKDKDGNYYKMAYDQAIMLPLLEMSADRSAYIPETLYVYNKGNPLNVDKIKAQEQYDTAQEIRAKSSYSRIEV